MPFCTPKCRKWTIFSLSIFFVLLGIIMVLFWGDLVESIKRKELGLSDEHTTAYKMWVETPIPMYIEFHLFNWTNWKEVVDSNWTTKPSFTDVGPYTFSEHHIRKQVKFNNNRTITYKTQRIWHFLPEKSVGSLDDRITTLNPILMTVGDYVKYKHAIVKIGVNFFLEEKGVKLTVTKTAGEFLFDGYDDPMLDLLKKLHIKVINIPFTKFGWFSERNNSIDFDGTFNMYDGTDDVQKLGNIAEWNFVSRTEYFPSYCGDVNGTSGELMHPVDDTPSIEIFASDICSTAVLYHSGEEELLGITGHKYIGTEKLFDNGTKYPEMACFSPWEENWPSGVRNISQCKYGAPAFVSYPHFYLADPSYREAIDGMHPNKSEHEFFVSVEPDTGIPIHANAAFQLNLRLEPISRIKLLENVKQYLLPVFWFKQSAKINEKLANEAKLILVLPAVGEYTGYGIIGIGCLLFVIFGYITWKNQWKGTDGEQLLDQ